MLLDGATATFAANGVAEIRVGPPANRRWRIDRIDIQVPAAATEPKCFVYRNIALPSNHVDATYQGSRNSTDAIIDLRSGEAVVIRWTEGTVGQTAIANIFGTDTADV